MGAFWVPSLRFALCHVGLTSISPCRRQLVDRVGYLATGADQIGHEPVVHVEGAFVLGPIPHIVTLRQDSPDVRTQAKSVRQHLKDDVPLRWPESVVSQRRQTKCVSGAVGEIEPAVQRVRIVLRVLQPRQARTHQTCKLLRIGRFLCEDVYRTGEALPVRRRWRSSSDPITQSFGCSTTRLTNTFSVRAPLKTRRPCKS